MGEASKSGEHDSGFMLPNCSVGNGRLTSALQAGFAGSLTFTGSDGTPSSAVVIRSVLGKELDRPDEDF